MPELEKIIEEKLIDQLIYGDSQWTYRKDLKTEEDLWKNFKYILEQNNKDRLNGESLSESEFEQVKNQLQFSSFYKAGEWLVGENGKVQVHVQRDTERLHLVVMNHEHIAGGSSVYEVINQYSALKNEEDDTLPARDRRFDVTLMINGLPMIHIELKNRQHSYMDGFHQIKKYIGEGKFTGIFSAVQMFVVSNGEDTKYFAAANDTELNPKFIMSNLVYEIELDERKYRGQSILNIVENMKHDCIDKVVSDFCRTWYASKEDVMYAALHYRNGEIPNESVIKSTIDYTMYKEVQEKAVPKFKYYAQCMKELKKVLDEEIKPLIDIA